MTAVTELSEKFSMRKNDPSSQANMQRMMRNFRIYEQLVQTFDPELNNMVLVAINSDINEVRKSVARLLLYYVKSNELN